METRTSRIRKGIKEIQQTAKARRKKLRKKEMKKGVLNRRRMFQSHQKRFKMKITQTNKSTLMIRRSRESLNSESKTILRKEWKRK